MTDYALRFISGKYQGGQFKLKMEREVTVGRATDGDMVLVEDMVSRRHSKIITTGGKVTIMDNGSTNGTFVNGERVFETPVELKEGDRILIGTSVLKLVIDGDSLNEVARGSGANSEDGRRTTMSITRHMSGSIHEIPIPDLLQLLSTSRKSGVLSIFSGDNEGKIYIRSGKVFYSSINYNFELDPTKAFFRLLTWTQGTFDLLPPDRAEFLNEIQESTEALLMEGMRVMDEINRLGSALPPLEAHLSLVSLLEKPLKDLTPEQLDVLQLAHNVGSVQLILDRSPYSDIDTYEILIHLQQECYLTQAG